MPDIYSYQQFLDRITVVMVNTTLPANIGSAARAMHTMGLSKLTVVEPKRPIDNDAIAHAAGAKTILDNAKIVPSLAEAVAQSHWVLAASSRKRHLSQLVITPRQASHLMLEQFLKSPQISTEANFNIALVFGREDRGLTNEELQLADYHIQIPANPSYGVLNVAAAVQVIASVFFETAVENLASDFCQDLSDLPLLSSLTPVAIPSAIPPYPIQDFVANSPVTKVESQMAYIIRQDWDEAMISHTQKQQLHSRVLHLLQKLELYNPDEPKSLPHRLARLSQRLQLDVKEYELLQAVIAKIDKKIG